MNSLNPVHVRALNSNKPPNRRNSLFLQYFPLQKRVSRSTTNRKKDLTQTFLFPELARSAVVNKTRKFPETLSSPENPKHYTRERERVSVAKTRVACNASPLELACGPLQSRNPRGFFRKKRARIDVFNNNPYTHTHTHTHAYV